MILDRYQYPEPNGVVRLQKLRFAPKSFRMEARRQPGYTWVNPSVIEGKYPHARELFHSLLFNLPLLLDDPPYIATVEGEKDAKALTEAGVPSLSHWQGAQNFTEGQAERFRGYTGRVFVVADADVSGAACAVRRYDLLRAIGISERRMTLLVPASGCKDSADHLAARHSLREFRRWPLGVMREIAATAPTPTRSRDYDPGPALVKGRLVTGGRR